MLAPAPPVQPVQFIDVRDLADWIGSATEDALDGVYNATGDTITFEQLIDECRRVSSDAEIVWVPSERLVSAGVGEWMELPLWIVTPEYSATHRTDVSKAKRRAPLQAARGDDRGRARVGRCTRGSSRRKRRPDARARAGVARRCLRRTLPARR